MASRPRAWSSPTRRRASSTSPTAPWPRPAPTPSTSCTSSTACPGRWPPLRRAWRVLGPLAGVLRRVVRAAARHGHVGHADRGQHRAAPRASRGLPRCATARPPSTSPSSCRQSSSGSAGVNVTADRIVVTVLGAGPAAGPCSPSSAAPGSGCHAGGGRQPRACSTWPGPAPAGSGGSSWAIGCAFASLSGHPVGPAHRARPHPAHPARRPGLRGGGRRAVLQPPADLRRRAGHRRGRGRCPPSTSPISRAWPGCRLRCRSSSCSACFCSRRRGRLVDAAPRRSGSATRCCPRRRSGPVAACSWPGCWSSPTWSAPGCPSTSAP